MTLDEQRVSRRRASASRSARPASSCRSCCTPASACRGSTAPTRGIARGQKTHDFFGRLVARRYATPYVGAQRQDARLPPPPQGALPGHRRARHAASAKPVALARAVERLMLLDHVLAEPAISLARRPSERRSSTSRRTTPLRPEELPSLTFGDGADTTTRYFPDGCPSASRRTGSDTSFSISSRRTSRSTSGRFLHRHASCSGRVPEWDVRLLVPRHR